MISIHPGIIAAGKSPSLDFSDSVNSEYEVYMF